MKIKKNIRLFIPPIYYRLKCCIKYGRSILAEPQTEVDKMYHAIRAMNERYRLKLDDLPALSADVPYGGTQMVKNGDEYESNYYGSFHTLQKYANIPFRNFAPKNLNIQHGYICEMLNWEMRKLEHVNWVWSPKVKSMYQEHTDNPHIVAIGAPFFYATSILSQDEITEERKRLGKNLLAFPSHSTYHTNCLYNTEAFVNLLEQLRTKFDNIRVCVYWADYQRGFAKPYLDAGFECVCCGHLLDPFFLERQKAIFEIADATISNAVGSHVGYSIYMNKPHWLIEDNVEWKDIPQDYHVGAKATALKEDSSNLAEIHKAFINNSDFQITDEQRRVVEKYWGTNSVKTPEEMFSLIYEAYKLSE